MLCKHSIDTKFACTECFREYTEMQLIKEKPINELSEKYSKLLEFVKKIKSQSCCNVCNCLSCDAKKVLEEIGELND